ncbi:MAG: phosphoenolpyruvate kinase [Deltaproteobacteria bacterium]|nr:phosphoenolpyruvate kinase [Deltaproteobacteria bacterium]
MASTTSTTLSASDLAAPLARLRDGNLAFAARYPGESGKRQPVHTVYGGAHLFKSDTAKKLGTMALASLREHAPEAETLATALGLTSSPDLRATLYRRVVEKLEREPVEDFRIDFEDGYGNRPDVEEDGHAEAAALEVARGLADGTLPPFVGIRIKPFTEELRVRSMRTLDVFLTALARATGGKLPPGFVVTLPKVTLPEQPRVLADMLDLFEKPLGIEPGALKLELMIETTQSIFDSDGRAHPPKLVEAARGRCVAAHFGTYDYTASCSITAAHQRMAHPSCDFAKHVLQVSLAGTGVWLSDGATNIMPVPVHRAAPGQSLSETQRDENRAAVHRAWRIAYDHVRHSLEGAYYQGWDLHPGQLPVRYAAVYGFFLEGLDEAGARLTNFVGKAAQATLVGDVFDDAATGQGLLNYFLRAVGCGAITEEEAVARSGLTLDELRGRTFVGILKNRARPR